MSIAIINGSPKRKKSATEIILNLLKKNIRTETETFYKLSEETKNSLIKSDVWVIAFPVYVDGVPSNLLEIMREIDDLKIGASNKKIYAIANCGFHEGAQSKIALKVIQNWCARCGCEYAGGIGIGGCGFLGKVDKTKIFRPLTHKFRKGLVDLSKTISNKISIKNKYTSLSLPRWAYILVANLGWKYLQKDFKRSLQ